MLSGRQTLFQLSSTLQSARSELQRLDQELQANSLTMAANRQQQAQALKQLAAMRLDAIREGEVAKRIDAADYKVREILDRRRDAISQLHERVARATEALSALEQQRDRLHEEVDAAAQALAEREAEVQGKLQSDPAFQAQLDKTRTADAVAVSAEEKAQVVAEDRREKGRPYEQDPLFMYLWERHYGTSEYRANPLARLLDAWVARLCKYQSARPNYWMLQEIPRRLLEHAERKRANVESELDALQSLEEQAAEAGGVHQAKAALTSAEQKQDEVDEEIAQSEATLRELQTEQSQYAAGDDRFIAQSLGILSETLQRQDVTDLTRLARATMTAQDDAIVDDLRDLRAEESALEDELDRNRSLHAEHLRRVQELESVRRKFKQHRYDDLRSGFDKGDLIASMMREVLGGAIRGGALWNVLQQYQRYRDVAGAWPDFGSGGIPRSRRKTKSRPSSWHWPGASTARRGSGFKLPRAPKIARRGRGGFRTGGGF